MLYATTRDPKETFTAQWALTGDREPDGGFYVPFREPYFYAVHLKAFREMNFLQVEAEILNLLFGTHVTDTDLLFAAGKSPVKLQKIGRRTFAAERWRNTGWCFRGYVSHAERLLRVEKEKESGTWAETAVGIAVLFALVTELQRENLLPKGETLSVAVCGEETETLLSCLYAKAWGLPIGKVVCGCRESRGLWDLIHNGMMQTDVLEPDSRQVDGLEMLMCCEGGQAEAKRFLNCVKRGKVYVPGDALLKRLRKDLAASVISDGRILETVPGVYGTHHYVCSLDGALAYAGLLDCRATSESGSWGLVLCDQSPSFHRKEIARALQMEEQEVEKLLRYT